MEDKDNPVNQYVRLRTILDSLEDGCLRYYLSHQGSRTGTERFNTLRESLMPIIELVWGADEIICPPGYFNCDGVCVPYECPKGTEPRPHDPK